MKLELAGSFMLNRELCRNADMCRGSHKIGSAREEISLKTTVSLKLRAFCILSLAFVGLSTALLGQQNLLPDGSFEAGGKQWRLVVAADSNSAGCAFDVVNGQAHTGKWAALLSSKSAARFGICPTSPRFLHVRAGEHYRLTAWIKAGDDFQPEAGTAGVVIRATLFQAAGVDYKGGHIFIGLNGASQPEAAPLSAGQSVPKEWTKLESVIEIPQGVNGMTFFVFFRKASGKLWVDDVSLIRE